MFEIRRVFDTARQEIGLVTEGQFNIAKAVNEYGKDQLVDNITSMLNKEAGRGARSSGVNLQHNPVDYLQDNYQGEIAAKVREEAVLSIL